MSHKLWVDAYCPKTLDECDCHPTVAAELKRIADYRDIPHLILHGPSGAGKQTRVRALLKAVFGDGAGKIKPETIVVESSGFPFETMQSPFHTEVYASDLGFKDKQCIQIVIKNLASTYSASSLISIAKDKSAPCYRVFIIQEAHTLSLPAQAALRRTMERFSASARIILLTEKLSGIIDPLKSRCFCIRVPLPQTTEVVSVLRSTASQAMRAAPDDTTLTLIANAAHRNLRVALILLQRATKSGKINSANLDKHQARWKQIVIEICDKINRNQSPQSLLEVREDLAHMIVTCVPSQEILEALTTHFLTIVSNMDMKRQVIEAAAHYSHAMLKGTKELLFLETFVQTVACIIQRGTTLKT
eukprot:Gregarina_sp_Poly_1__4692@NODE_2507_length_2047_cov_83_604040_g1593_i0_p1_GENE_NODE_2507_length_2047_cov_83_604040_g1593_i0NODE_2507_length_2047_cov_83_604040_g1593_i0_p1_ORF_typecomplete_len360_score36_98DNA_pol3_delta2/PF13177_6/3_5e25DNA_pol3_delta2/PF13177_6/2_8Rad17/PF03215_15/1_1e10Rad17/PF03215_15/3_5e03RuvB_N/PF05496_12/0_0031RuvB_N/PF05496_12/8_5RuvB_N/PF05496_12/2_1e02AAA_30/PF13604_6/0_00037AAA/PF00004_29/0_00098AAA/PF00004_29/1_7e03AAA_22/PF13401_6/0_007AAA_22/PF13401_6/2_6e02Flavi_D